MLSKDLTVPLLSVMNVRRRNLSFFPSRSESMSVCFVAYSKEINTHQSPKGKHAALIPTLRVFFILEGLASKFSMGNSEFFQFHC